ncbi:phage major capsid protein, HK97 family [Jonesia denitrificans]|nr:phage major capsid protein, HK97 family [Jonesia denitrificans]
MQPAGLEDLTGVTDVDAGAAWTKMDSFAEAISNAEAFGLNVDAFVANPADVLLLAQLKEATGSNRPLLGADPSNPTKRILQGVRLFSSSAVTAGTVWGIPQPRALMVRRKNVDLQVDRSAYFTSDRTAIRATMRVGFAFPHEAAIQKVSLTA